MEVFVIVGMGIAFWVGSPVLAVVVLALAWFWFS